MRIEIRIPLSERNEIKKVNRAFQKAVDECYLAGGGTVFVPDGDYTVGSVFLKDNVTLEMDAACRLISPVKQEDFDSVDPTVPYKSRVSSIIYLIGCRHVRIKGGQIIGNGKAFWTPKKESEIGESWCSTPIRYWENDFRPYNIFSRDAEDIEITDTVITDSPMYSVWLTESRDILIRNVTIENDLTGPNTDGIHFCSCRNVLAEKCRIIAGDDAFAVDANAVGISENIEIRECTMRSTVNVIRIYTNLGFCKKNQAKVRNISLHDCKVENAAGVLNITAQRGSITDIFCWNMDIDMKQEGTAFFLMTDAGYIGNVEMFGWKVRANGVGTIIGTKEYPVGKVTLRDMDFLIRPTKKLYDDVIPDPMPGYWRHHFAPCDFYIRHAEEISANHLNIAWEENPAFEKILPAVDADDAELLKFRNCDLASCKSDEIIKASNVGRIIR